MALSTDVRLGLMIREWARSAIRGAAITGDAMSKRAELGSIIRSARIEKGFSQLCVAAELGLTNAQSISNIERGCSMLPAKHIAKLSFVLGLDAAFIADAIISIEHERIELTVRSYGDQG